MHCSPVSRARLISIILAAMDSQHFSSQAPGSQAYQLGITCEKFVFRVLPLLNWTCQISLATDKATATLPRIQVPFCTADGEILFL